MRLPMSLAFDVCVQSWLVGRAEPKLGARCMLQRELGDNYQGEKRRFLTHWRKIAQATQQMLIEHLPQVIRFRPFQPMSTLML